MIGRNIVTKESVQNYSLNQVPYHHQAVVIAMRFQQWKNLDLITRRSIFMAAPAHRAIRSVLPDRESSSLWCMHSNCMASSAESQRCVSVVARPLPAASEVSNVDVHPRTLLKTPFENPACFGLSRQSLWLLAWMNAWIDWLIDWDAYLFHFYWPI